jgi:hypothetical protein
MLMNMNGFAIVVRCKNHIPKHAISKVADILEPYDIQDKNYFRFMRFINLFI